MSDLRLKYGTFTGPGGGIAAVTRTVLPVVWNSFSIGWEHKLQIDGYVYGSGSSNVAAAMAIMEAAVSVQDVDVGVVDGGGTATGHYLTVADSLDSVRLVNFQWADSPLNLATEAKYTLQVEALYGNGFLARDIVELSEVVEVRGEGGSITPLAPQATTQSIYQTTSQYSDVVVSQQGVITARFAHPSIPSPVITTTNARQVGRTRVSRSVVQRGTGIEVFRAQYGYEFHLPGTPGTVVPNILT